MFNSRISTKKPRLLEQGLPNIGNTCFLNTIINCLFSSSSFRNHLLQLKCKTSLSQALKDIFQSLNNIEYLQQKAILMKRLTKILQREIEQYTTNSQQDVLIYLMKFYQLMKDVFTHDMFDLSYRKVCLNKAKSFIQTFSTKFYYFEKELFTDPINQVCDICNNKIQKQHCLVSILTHIPNNIFMYGNNQLQNNNKLLKDIYTSNKEVYFLNYEQISDHKKQSTNSITLSAIRIVKYSLKSRALYCGDNQTGHYIAIRRKMEEKIYPNQAITKILKVQSDQFYKFNDDLVTKIQSEDECNSRDQFEIKFSLYEVDKIYKMEDFLRQLTRINKKLNEFNDQMNIPYKRQIQQKINCMKKVMQDYNAFVQYKERYQISAINVQSKNTQTLKKQAKVNDKQKQIIVKNALNIQTSNTLQHTSTTGSICNWFQDLFSTKKRSLKKQNINQKVTHMEELSGVMSINNDYSPEIKFKIMTSIKKAQQQIQILTEDHQKINVKNYLQNQQNNVQQNEHLNMKNMKNNQLQQQNIYNCNKLSQNFEKQNQNFENKKQKRQLPQISLNSSKVNEFLNKQQNFSKQQLKLCIEQKQSVNSVQQVQQKHQKLYYDLINAIKIYHFQKQTYFYQTSLSKLIQLVDKNQANILTSIKNRKIENLKNHNLVQNAKKLPQIPIFFHIKYYNVKKNLQYHVVWIQDQQYLIKVLFQQIIYNLKNCQQQIKSKNIYPQHNKSNKSNKSNVVSDNTQILLLSLAPSFKFTKYWEDIKKLYIQKVSNESPSEMFQYFQQKYPNQSQKLKRNKKQQQMKRIYSDIAKSIISEYKKHF